MPSCGPNPTFRPSAARVQAAPIRWMNVEFKTLRRSRSGPCRRGCRSCEAAARRFTGRRPAAECDGAGADNLGRLQEAADVFRRLLGVPTDDVEALASLGHVLAASYPEGAGRALRRALELDPSGIRALKGMQRILAGSRRLEEARAYAGRVVELEPEAPDNWLNLAELLGP